MIYTLAGKTFKSPVVIHHHPDLYHVLRWDLSAPSRWEIVMPVRGQHLPSLLKPLNER